MQAAGFYLVTPHSHWYNKNAGSNYRLIVTWRIRLAVRTPPSQGGDHGFESRMRYQRKKNPCFVAK